MELNQYSFCTIPKYSYQSMYSQYIYMMLVCNRDSSIISILFLCNTSKSGRLSLKFHDENIY